MIFADEFYMIHEPGGGEEAGIKVLPESTRMTELLFVEIVRTKDKGSLRGK